MLDSILLTHEIFAPEFSAPVSFRDTLEDRLNDLGFPYPSFAISRPNPPISKVAWDGSGFTAEDVTGSWDNLEHLIDFIKNDLDKVPSYDESIRTAPGVTDNHIMGMEYSFSGKSTSRGSTRNRGAGLALREPVDWRRKDVYGYYNFLCNARFWLNQQDDISAAYGFIGIHPAFWYRPDFQKNPYGWKNGGHQAIIISPTWNQDGSAMIGLETGPSTSPEYRHHSHDTDLEAWASSFDAAYKELAIKIHDKYNLDGSRRS